MMNSSLTITNSMEPSPSWKTASCAVTQEFPNILWNTKVHNHVHKNPRLVPSWTTSLQSIEPHSVSLRSILILSMSRSSWWSLSYRLFHQNPICIPLLPHAWYMSCPSHPPWIHHSNYTMWRVQVMKLLIIQCSPITYHLIPLWSKYSQHHSQTP
jgi:hypothetical protein